MITYAANKAGASKGAYAIFPVIDPGGSGPVEVFDADVVTGVVTAVSGGVPISSIQAAALSSILKGLISFGTVAGNELEYLRKLVGVLPLTDGDVVTLSVNNVAGNVWRLQATLAAPGTVFVYVPNTAASGVFTGVGASVSAGGGTPTGPAGGVLGYPGSTYPDPNGLATQIVSGNNVLPIHGPGTGADLFIRPDASVGAGVAGDNALYIGAAGGDGTPVDAAGAGGDLRIAAGAAGADNGGGGAAGGSTVIRGGENSDGTNAPVKINDTGRGQVQIGSGSKPHGTLVIASEQFLVGESGIINTNPFSMFVNGGPVFTATGGGAAAIELDPPLAAGQTFLFVNRSGQPQTFSSTANQQVGNAGSRTVSDGGSIMFYAATASVWFEIAFTDATS